MNNIKVELVRDPIDHLGIVQSVKQAGVGAVVVFAGTTRDEFRGKEVVYLEYEAHNSMAIKTMTSIANEAWEQWPLKAISVVHRLGVVPILEESIHIATSAAHRKEAYLANEYILEQVKKRAEIWKKEMYSDQTWNWKVN